MGRDERSDRMGGAKGPADEAGREKPRRNKGAADGVGPERRLMGRGETGGRWGEARGAADGAGREKRRRKKEGQSMGRGERGGGRRKRVSQRVGRKWLLPPPPPLLPPPPPPPPQPVSIIRPLRKTSYFHGVQIPQKKLVYSAASLLFHVSKYENHELIEELRQFSFCCIP